MNRSHANAVAALAATLALGAAPAGAASAASAGAPDGGAIFARHCARCHGADARGSPNGPSLRPAVRQMSEAAFTATVLERYRWTLPAGAAGGEDAAREALVRGVLQRQADDKAMPAWQGEPAVADGVRALYRYLAALPR